MADNFTIVNRGSKGKKVTITLTGVITSFDSSNTFKAVTFINEFKRLQAEYTHIHIDIINLYGGSIIEGIPVYNHIKDSIAAGLKVTGKIDGLAASMGSIIAMAIPAENLEMGRMSRLMNHRATGGAWGNADEVKNAADTILSYEDDLVEILSERTGWTDEKVRNKWMDGLDHYIKATEAKKIGLVGKITQSKTIEKEPSNISNPIEMYKFYQNQISNIKTNPKNMENLVQAITSLQNAGITIKADATENDVLTGINTLSAALATAKTDLTAKTEALETANTAIKEFETQRVTDLVENAIHQNKITAAQKDSIIKMAESDFEAAKTFLENQTSHKTLCDQLNKDKSNPTPGNTDDPEKTFNWYRKNAPKELENMRKTNKEQYDALYANQYGDKS